MNPVDFVLIKDIRPGLKNINVIFIVLEIGMPTITKEKREVCWKRLTSPLIINTIMYKVETR